VREASRTARASALYGDVRKTGATAVCDPRAAAVCRRASASSRASRVTRSAADSCGHQSAGFLPRHTGMSDPDGAAFVIAPT